MSEPGHDTPSGAPPPAVEMAQTITNGLWLAKAVYAAAALGIADLLADGPKTPAVLAEAAQAHPRSLHRLLRTLASVGIFAEDDEGRFALTPLAATLQDRPGSMRALALMFGATWHWDMWAGFLHSVRTGEDGVSHAIGEGFFDHLRKHPERLAVFDDAMTGFSAMEAEGIAGCYDFAGLRTLVDVAGGHGFLLATILKAHPHLEGVLFEVPAVVDGARALLDDQGVGERCRIEAGDMFQNVPAGDAHIMKNIIHDWDDERCLTLLKNCRDAVAPNGRLLVVQQAVPPGNNPAYSKMLDMQMLLIGGIERTESEFRSLFDAAGYRLARVIETGLHLHLIEGVPA